MTQRSAATTQMHPALTIGLAAVLVVTFITGGGSQDYGRGDVLAQLLALPLLVAATWAASKRRADNLQRAAVGVAFAVALLPALQLLPLPDLLWSLPAGRARLLEDLQAAGVTPLRRWTLAPESTEHALWSQLPALAAFFGALALGRRDRRRMVVLVVGLVFAGLLLGLVQLQAGQQSVFNLFPQWVPLADGVFANPNHQGAALVIGAVLALGLLLDRRNGAGRRVRRPWVRWVSVPVAAACLLALPLTDSRAALLIAAPAAVALLVSTRALAWTRINLRLTRVGLAVALAAAAASLATALYVFKASIETEARWPMARATLALARDAWPLGTGVGSFPRWFEQSGPDSLLLGESINHAHNEYVQWALEGGLPAVVLVAGVIATLVLTGRALWRKPAAGVGHAAWICVAVLMGSSLVEYPLRTPALMTFGALLAGVAIAEARVTRTQPRAGET